MPPFEELGQKLAAGQDEAAAQLFYAAGLGRPRVLWRPESADLADPRLRAFLAHVGSVVGDTLPAFDGFLDDLPEHLKASVILARLESDLTLHYDWFGPEVADQFGQTLLGPIDGRMPDYIQTFYCAAFHAAFHRRDMVMTEHEPPPQVFVQAWQRLVLPLAGAEGAVAGFAVMNVAVNPLRAGLDAVHDAVFVLRADQRILYANPNARLLMPTVDGYSQQGDFFAETGIALPDLATPEDMLGHGTVEARRSLALRDTLLTDVEVTVSAVMHRAQTVYIVIVRPC